MVLFFAWHAALSLCGPGHHALSNFVEHLASVDRSAFGAEDSPAPNAHSDSDCPVCHFLLQAFHAPPTAPATFHFLAVDDSRTIDPARADEPIFSRINPRAPPRSGV